MSTTALVSEQSLNRRLAASRPSSFVLRCLDQITERHRGLALDLACGNGRHSRVLASTGYKVVCVDVNDKALRLLQEISVLVSNRHAIGETLHPVRADARMNLPFKSHVFDVVVVVHYVLNTTFIDLANLLINGGYLIYETYDARGGNWMDLPCKGEVLEAANSFGLTTLVYREKHAGPRDSGRATVRLFARNGE